jgi:hypothetical protein
MWQMLSSADYAALDAYLDRRDPVQQSIATVISGSGSKAWVKPLGAGGKPIEVRVAIGTPLAAGDEVYMIRSKWQPDWIILTNLGKVGAHSNAQNTTPIHSQGASQSSNLSYLNDISTAGISTSVAIGYVSDNEIVHNAKTETILVTGTVSFTATGGVGGTLAGVSVFIDGVDQFPAAPPAGFNITSAGAGMPFGISIPVKGVKPGTRTIDLRGKLHTGTSGVYTFRCFAIHVVDIGS